ncbi:hypothetical protein PO909_027676 [Leuciscus waleckii]
MKMFLPVLLCLCFWRLDGVFGDAVKLVSVMEGDSVTLNSPLTEIQTGDLIQWRFGSYSTRIARLNRELSEISMYDVLDGRFRDRLKLDNQTGSLTIMNIRPEHDGLYKVEIISGSRSETQHRFSVAVYGPPSDPPPDPVSLIVLITAVTVAGVLLSVGVIWMFCYCRKHRDEDQNHDQTDATLYKHFGQMKVSVSESFLSV